MLDFPAAFPKALVQRKVHLVNTKLHKGYWDFGIGLHNHIRHLFGWGGCLQGEHLFSRGVSTGEHLFERGVSTDVVNTVPTLVRGPCGEETTNLELRL